MTPQEKLNAIKKAELEFFNNVEILKKNYRLAVKKIIADAKKAKLAKARKELGL